MCRNFQFQAHTLGQNLLVFNTLLLKCAVQMAGLDHADLGKTCVAAPQHARGQGLIFSPPPQG